MRQLSCIYVTKRPLETKNSLMGVFVFEDLGDSGSFELPLEDVALALRLALNGGRKQVFSCFPEKQMFSPEVQMCPRKTPLSCIFKFR